MKKIIMFLGILLLTTVLVGCGESVDSKDKKDSIKTVTIYSKDGKVLHQYEGKVSAERVTDNKFTKIDIDGKKLRVVNADVVIEEKGIEKFETK
ncbi:hypothetical protein [Staphylococcus phage S6]|nr:hypothetical protein [Staphylococcus phage S6]